ncbi:MAG TPA: hypothetical protein VJA47_06350 [archaeon]|nr:hypothetical protein [archaeon]
MRYNPLISKKEFDAEDLLTVADDSFMKYDFEGCYLAATKPHRKGHVNYRALLSILKDLSRANISKEKATHERYVLMALRKVEKFHQRGHITDIDMRRLRTRSFGLARAEGARNYGEPSPTLSAEYDYLDMKYWDAKHRDDVDRVIVQRRENRGDVREDL